MEIIVAHARRRRTPFLARNSKIEVPFGDEGLMFRVKVIILMVTLCGFMRGAIASGEDPTRGATNFVFVPAGNLWHPIGPAKLITTWSGPFRNAGGHPANIYMIFTKAPTGTSQAVKPLPNDLRVYHMLGTDFYYPANAHPRAVPAELGYTTDGFAIADKLSSAFPAVAALFPGGILTSSCLSKRSNYSLIIGRKAGASYLISWVAPNQVEDVVYLPAKFLTGSLDSILDNMSYYEQGGMYEIMRFGALFYYLSRVPLAHSLGHLHISRECPDTATDTPTGVSTPAGWTEALRSLHQR